MVCTNVQNSNIGRQSGNCCQKFNIKTTEKVPALGQARPFRYIHITINAPLILKMRDIIFFLRANYIIGHFKGYFEGAKTFLTPKLSRAQNQKK